VGHGGVEETAMTMPDPLTAAYDRTIPLPEDIANCPVDG